MGFQKEWHQNKADLLHDIICMANNLSNQDGLIIIGVDEENDYSICDVINDPNRRKTQDIVSFCERKNLLEVSVQQHMSNQSLCGKRQSILLLFVMIAIPLTI